MNKKTILLLLAATLSCLVTAQNNYDIAMKYYYGSSGYSQSYERALQYLIEECNKQNPDDRALIKLCGMYLMGEGTSVNLDGAERLANKLKLIARDMATASIADDYLEEISKKKGSTTITKLGATIEKIWLEHNVSKNGEKGMMIHSRFSVNGLKGTNIQVIAFFRDSERNPLKGGIIPEYTMFDGPCVKGEANAIYENSLWEDYKLFIPYKALPFASGKNTYYVRIYIRNKQTGVWLNGNSPDASFVGTGYKNNAGGVGNNQQSIAYMDIHSKYSQYKKFGGDRVVRSEKDTDGKDYVFYYANGWVERIGYDECSNCHGRPTCDYCGGKGYTEMWIISNAVRTTCIPCKGSGGCYFCNGEGVSRFIDARNERTRLGYVKLPYTGGTLVSLDDNKNTGGSYNTGNYNPNLSSGNYTPSGSNKIRCHSCGGSGRCGFCGGRGEKRNSYSGNLNDCDMCRGGGVCSLCRGKGVN